jgi:hypothetical protein
MPEKHKKTLYYYEQFLKEVGGELYAENDEQALAKTKELFGDVLQLLYREHLDNKGFFISFHTVYSSDK